MDSKIVNGLALVLFGLIGFLFRDKIVKIQNFFNDDTPVEIRRKKVEVVSIIAIIAGIVFSFSSKL